MPGCTIPLGGSQMCGVKALHCTTLRVSSKLHLVEALYPTASNVHKQMCVSAGRRSLDSEGKCYTRQRVDNY